MHNERPVRGVCRGEGQLLVGNPARQWYSSRLGVERGPTEKGQSWVEGLHRVELDLPTPPPAPKSQSERLLVASHVGTLSH